MTPEKEIKKLRSELMGLFHYIKRVRSEIAAISRGADEEHNFDSMGEQLDAIIKSTDEATHTIMGVTEKNDNLIEEISQSITDKDQLAKLEQVNENSQHIFEACSFQDLTGQRISKIIKSITFVEERVDKLVEIWGRNEVAKVELEAEQKSDDEKLLHGPALAKEESFSQADIDKLFD